jgi:hypothetical protein
MVSSPADPGGTIVVDVVVLIPEPQSEELFVRSDANDDGVADISDPVFVLGCLLSGGPRPVCYDAADATDDGNVDVSDAVRTLEMLFLGGASISEPFPLAGEDPTADLITCSSNDS